MNLETHYHEACGRADAARSRLAVTAQEAKGRVAPARLTQDLKNKVSGAINGGVADVVSKVQQRPVATGAAATAFVLFLAREPLTALFRRLHVRLKTM